MVSMLVAVTNYELGWLAFGCLQTNFFQAKMMIATVKLINWCQFQGCLFRITETRHMPKLLDSFLINLNNVDVCNQSCSSIHPVNRTDGQLAL